MTGRGAELDHKSYREKNRSEKCWGGLFNRTWISYRNRVRRESKYILIQPAKIRKDWEREGWGSGKGNEHPLTVHSGATGAQKLQVGLKVHSPEPHCPPEEPLLCPLLADQNA